MRFKIFQQHLFPCKSIYILSQYYTQNIYSQYFFMFLMKLKQTSKAVKVGKIIFPYTQGAPSTPTFEYFGLKVH